ncbi:MAG: crossover junction endodeoxyribonuclease RuvC, partial [Chlamydiales bacterium]|nr:crossover junction endodeoxyribonuclease RuvC [Chlamydiales bacterium]
MNGEQKKSPHPIILGIDPGTRITGYGVIHKKNHEIIPIDFGAIRPPPSLEGPQKYLVIFNAIEALLEKFSPDAVSIETQFVYKNVQSAMKLGMARGVALLAAAKRGIPIFEYSP